MVFGLGFFSFVLSLSIMLFLVMLNFPGGLVDILVLLTQYPLHDQQFCP